MFASLCARNKQTQHILKLIQLLEIGTIYISNNGSE